MNRRQSLKTLSNSFLVSLFPIQGFKKIISSGCDTCKQAWISLGKLTSTRYIFRYIEPQEHLPKVFIYGDSISIGYTEFVRACLEDKATIHRLHMNGGSSSVFIRKMELIRRTMFQPFLKGGWDFDWDVIHFNVGLHDLKYVVNLRTLDKKNGTLMSSIETYEENLHQIIQYLKKTYPRTKLIFATTTVIPKNAAGRFEGDEIKYNEAALRVIKQYKNIIINDLYTASISTHKNHKLNEGNVHYNQEGYRELGIQVAKEIAKVLYIKPLECPPSREITLKARNYESQLRRKS